MTYAHALRPTDRIEGREVLTVAISDPDTVHILFTDGTYITTDPYEEFETP